MSTSVLAPQSLSVSSLCLRTLLAVTTVALAGCSDDGGVSVAAEPDVGVGDAAPQDTPVPTGDANDIARPQIEFVGAPDVVLPGQVVSVRLGTDYTPADGVVAVAVVIDGVPGWFKAVAIAEPAAASDDAAYIVPVSVVIADTAPAGEPVKLEFALLLENDAAGGFASWEPTIDPDEVAECPEDIDCSSIECGPDPICGFLCGTCNDAEACNADGQCEAIGSACPDLAECGARECGLDPICGESCGSCAPGELCDPQGQCQPADMSCGDEVVEGSELCDGAELGGETCESQGFDDGTLACNATCDGFDTSGCTYTCGDDGIDPGEVCDGADLGTESCATQGFGGGTLACNATCDGFDTSGCTYTCGDGSVDPGEGCDDGNAVVGDGCDDSCAVETGFDCTGDPSVCTPLCGDGVIVGSEVCDSSDLSGQTCADQGFYGGTLACNSACNGYDVSACSGSCGDGTQNGSEVCDGTDLGGADCASQGYDGGTAVCNGTCDAIDYTGCSYTCGDGAVDPGEVCDGADLDGFDCVQQGFDAGTLACASDCTAFDTSSCSYTCGNDSASSSEVCDGTDLKGESCSSQGFSSGSLACAGDCSAYDTSACINVGEVGPLYPLNGEAWASWVSASGPGALDGSDVACDPTTANQCSGLQAGTAGRGDLLCQHAGARRQIVLPYTSCAGVTLSDGLGAFDWICDDTGGSAIGISTGLKEGKKLSDLIDWNASPLAWLDNSVDYSDGNTPGSSTAGKWWADAPVEYLAGGDLPTNPGVYAITQNVDLSFAFSAPQQAIVTQPGVTISGMGLNTHVIEVNGDSNNYRDFLWVEANIDALNDTDGVNLTFSRYSTIDYATIQNVNHADSSGVDIGQNCHGLRVQDLTLVNVNEGVSLRGSECNLIVDANIDGGANTSYSGVYFAGVTHSDVLHIQSDSNNRYGIDVNNADYIVVDDFRATGNNLGGFNCGSGGIENRVSNLTIGGSGNVGMNGGGWSNLYTNVVSIGNNGAGINCTGCRVQQFVSANNNGDGIFGASAVSLGIAASNNAEGFDNVELMVGVTAALNQSYGVANSSGPNLSIASLDNLSYGMRSAPAAYVTDYFGLFNNLDSTTQPYDVYDQNAGVTYSGLLGVTNATNSSSTNNSNGSCEATQTDPLNAGQGIDDDCTPINGSDFTIVSAPGTPVFMGQATPDSVNASDGDIGTALYETITDWSDFENRWRAWGEDGPAFPNETIPGVCRTNGETCAIYDWRLSVTDAVLQDALGSPYVVNATTDAVSYTFPTQINTESECNQFSGVWDSPIAGFCSLYFLRRALEIQGDGIGNDNAMCESGEDCIRLSHVGGYQGTGDLVSVQSIGTGGLVENVTLYEYSAW